MDWTFRLQAIPGLLVLAGLAVALHAPRERAHAAAGDRCSSPPRRSPTSRSTRGHPEDVLAAAAATAGVLAAVRTRATLAAVLLTVAVLAKQTAVLALLPAALALPRPKLRVLAFPVVAALLVYGGVQVLRPGGAHMGVARRLLLPPVAGLVAARRSRPHRSGPRPATATSPRRPGWRRSRIR